MARQICLFFLGGEGKTRRCRAPRRDDTSSLALKSHCQSSSCADSVSSTAGALPHPLLLQCFGCHSFSGGAIMLRARAGDGGQIFVANLTRGMTQQGMVV